MSRKNKVGVFNASLPLGSVFKKRVKDTINFFKQKNYEIELGELSNENDKYRSSSIKKRAEEFNKLLKNNNILISMIGGFNSSSILPYINYDLIKKNKTKIIGYSDTTAILLAIYAITGIETYYGPAFLPSFCEQKYIQDFNFKEFENMVNNDFKFINSPDFFTEDKIDWSKTGTKEYYKKMKKNKINSINEGIVKGRLLGGNLNTMISLLGSKYMPTFIKGDILFFEDSYTNISILERNLSSLKNSGILDLVSGIIIGKPEGFDNQGTNKKYHEVILEFLEKKIPIIYDFDCSHTLPMNTLKIGAHVKLDSKSKTLEFIN